MLWALTAALAWAWWQHVQGRTNCILVAAWYWARTRGRIWLCLRRSHGKRGRIPHMAAVAEGGNLAWHDRGGCHWDGAKLYILEYAPPGSERKDGVTQAGAFPLLFDGLYYLRRYRLDGEGQGNTFDGAVADLAQIK